MFEKLFAKYARAIDNEIERNYLFGKFKTKTVVSVIFYVLCIAVIVAALVLHDYIEQDFAMIIMTVLIFGWIGFAVANFCLWISFRKAYNKILSRPAYSDEMAEVTAYRQKTLQDKKSTFRKMWWAWLIFFVCIALFLAFIIVDTVQNPDSDEFGVWGGAACGVLGLGVLVLALAYFILGAVRSQKGTNIERQTAEEAAAIDAAQGREHVYKLENDAKIGTYEYLFPNRTLLERAEAVRKRFAKYILRSIGAVSLLALAAIILFACSGKLFGRELQGFALPVATTIVFAGIFAVTVPMNRKLLPIEKEQKAELETKPEYSDNLKWYRLYENFSKFQGRIYLAFVFAGLVLSWILAGVLPTTAWSLMGIVPMIIGLIVNNALVKNLRQKAIPIEQEIDRKRTALLKDVRFSFIAGDADEETSVFYDGDSLMYDGKTVGEITLYLGETYISMEILKETGRVVNFSSGQMHLQDLPQTELSLPDNAETGTLTAILDDVLPNGTGRRIVFDGTESYDENNKIFLVGNISENAPWKRIFANVYIQISEENKLLCVLCTEISLRSGQ